MERVFRLQRRFRQLGEELLPHFGVRKWEGRVMGSLGDNSISLRTQMLRDEIRSIQKQELLYRRTSHHSSAEAMAHASRELRLVTIAAEMEQLQKQTSGKKQG